MYLNQLLKLNSINDSSNVTVLSEKWALDCSLYTLLFYEFCCMLKFLSSTYIWCLAQMMIDAYDNIWFFFSLSLTLSCLPSSSFPLTPHFHLLYVCLLFILLSVTSFSLSHCAVVQGFSFKVLFKGTCLPVALLGFTLSLSHTYRHVIGFPSENSPGPYNRPILLRFAIFTQILNYIIVHILHSRSWHCYKMTAITRLWRDIHAAVLNLHFTSLEWG